MTNTTFIEYMARISLKKAIRDKYTLTAELFEMGLALIVFVGAYLLNFLNILDAASLLYIIITMLTINAMGTGTKIGTNLIFYRNTGFLQELYSSPITNTDKILGLIAEQIPATIAKATIILVLLAIIIKITAIQLIAIYFIVSLTAIIASLISIIISSKTNNLQILGIITAIAGFLQFGLNGLILKAKDIPIIMLNPYSYITDFFLHASQTSSNYPLIIDIIITITVIAIIYKMAVVAIDRLEIYG